MWNVSSCIGNRMRWNCEQSLHTEVSLMAKLAVFIEPVFSCCCWNVDLSSLIITISVLPHIMYCGYVTVSSFRSATASSTDRSSFFRNEIRWISAARPLFWVNWMHTLCKLLWLKRLWGMKRNSFIWDPQSRGIQYKLPGSLSLTMCRCQSQFPDDALVD